MPVKIPNSNSPSDYKIILNFEFQNLKPKKEFFVDYNLLKFNQDKSGMS